MKLNEYLAMMVSRKDATMIRAAIKQHRPIIISGVQRSGKTTLQRILQKHGGIVFEDWDAVMIHLNKTIPEEACVANYHQEVE